MGWSEDMVKFLAYSMREPKMKKEYEELLNRAEKKFDTFSLVSRDQLKYDNSASDIEKKLLSYLARTERTRMNGPASNWKVPWLRYDGMLLLLKAFSF